MVAGVLEGVPSGLLLLVKRPVVVLVAGLLRATLLEERVPGVEAVELVVWLSAHWFAQGDSCLKRVLDLDQFPVRHPLLLHQVAHPLLRAPRQRTQRPFHLPDLLRHLALKLALLFHEQLLLDSAV